MQVLRVLDAYCPVCREVVGHAVPDVHPATGFCNGCGSGQALLRQAPR